MGQVKWLRYYKHLLYASDQIPLGSNEHVQILHVEDKTITKNDVCGRIHYYIHLPYIYNLYCKIGLQKF